MKTRLLAPFLAFITILIPPASDAQDKKAISAYETAIGATSAQGVLVSYFAVNTLGDAVAGKAFSKEQALQVAAVYESTTKSASDALKTLLKQVEFTDADAAYINKVTKLYDTIGKQIAALKGVIDGEEDAAGAFESNRKKAQAMIDEIFGESGKKLTGDDEPAPKAKGKPNATGDAEAAPAPAPKKKGLLDE